ncbi:MAG: ABC transporter substrate-binding protein, partial [Clostridia bacterium]|nr:ABC transporter substrate-binding protein [Clostridia bacterium]
SAEAAKDYMLQNVENSPAWAELSAVKNGRYIFLPKELFHLKPLNRWDESYAYLSNCLLEKTE